MMVYIYDVFTEINLFLHFEFEFEDVNVHENVW